MDNNFTKTRLAAAIGSAALAMAIASPANAVVVVGGDNGWEVSFDGNVNGFYVNSDIDPLPTQASGGALAGATLSALAPDQDVARVRTGLLPAFFSFNAKSPTVNGLTGKARISFAPQINNANTESAFGAQIDMREVFFDVDGSFGTISVGRTLSLFQRKNILTDMTLFGVGVHGIQKGGGTTLGRIGSGYVYPQFNSRIAYKTPNMNGFQVEIGMFDPSTIGSETGLAATVTDTPAFEAEASYATAFGGGTLMFWIGGAYQEAEFAAGTVNPAAVALGGSSVETTGFHGGVQATYGGFDFVFSGYSGDGVGLTLQYDTDSLDPWGNERDNDGFIAQGAYTFNGKTKVGLSYGESNADETANEATCRNAIGAAAIAVACPNGLVNESRASEQNAWTVGVYHDVTSWLKLVAEYSAEETEWHGGETHEVDTFSVGGFFFW